MKRCAGRSLALGAAAMALIASPAGASTPWQVTPTPDPGQNFAYQQRDIYAVTSGGATHTYAVLSYLLGTTGPTGSKQLILHRSGTQWSTSSLPRAPKGNGYIESSSNVGGSDVWMFGFQGQCGPAQCLWAVHHTSHGWSTVTLGTPPTDLQPAVVRAFADHDIWQVGQDAITREPMAAHWDGSGWATSTPPLPSAAVSGGLIDVAPVPGTHDVVAVGWTTDSRGEYHAWATRFSGGTWHTMASGTQPPGEPAGVAIASATDAWMVGIRWGTASHTTYKPLIEHWNGTTWNAVAAPSIKGNGRLEAIAMDGAARMLAVGFRESASGVDRTLAEVFRGGSWATIGSPNPSTTGSDDFYDATHVPGTRDFWAVGTEGRKITPSTNRNTLAARYHG